MAAALHSDWLIPDWPAPAGVRAVFTTRAGGVSPVPYDSMNLGDHVGDQMDWVQANRALLKDATGAHMVFLNQVHGLKTQVLDAVTRNGQSADACVTAQRKLACTMMVADCLPVLLTTKEGGVVAAAHAGWRGLAGCHEGGILESVYASFKALAQSERAQGAIEIIAWLGPCIGPSAFEVGADVKAAFEAVQPQASCMFASIGSGKYLADLAGLARLRMQSLGITQVYGNDGSESWCTVRNPSKFFSHRRDAGLTGNGFGTTGRMAACIWQE